MNDLTVFTNQEFGEVRTIIIDDVVYFVGKDVADILGYSRPDHAINNHVDNEDKLMYQIDTLGQKRQMFIINESGLYSLILSSQLPNAKKFKRWVTSEVLPQIRKTGTYTNIPKSYAEALRMYANEVEQRELIEKQRDEAIRTKAWISDKKTATAMNTASQKVKENNQLRMELDRSKEYATVKKVEINTGVRFKWKPLREYCNKHNLPTGKVFDQNYGTVKTYPSKAWKDVYNINILEF